MTKKAKEEFIRRHFLNECTVALTDIHKPLDFNNINFRQPPNSLIDKNYSCIIYSDKLVNKSDLESVKDNDIDTYEGITDTAEQSQTSQETNSVSTKLMLLRSIEKGHSHRCLGCRVIFNDLSDVENHVHITYSCKYICKYCGQQFKSKQSFSDHVTDHSIIKKPNGNESVTPNNKNSNNVDYSSSTVQNVSFENDVKESDAENSSHVKHTTDKIILKKSKKYRLTKDTHNSNTVKNNAIRRLRRAIKKRNSSNNYNDSFKSVFNLKTGLATAFVDNPLIFSNTKIQDISVDLKNMASVPKFEDINNDSHMITKKNLNCNDIGIITDPNGSPNAKIPNLINNHALAVLPESAQTDTVQMHSSPTYIEIYNHEIPSGAKFSSLRPDQIFDCDLCSKRFVSKIAIDQHKIEQHKIGHLDYTVDTKKIKFKMKKKKDDISDDPKSVSQPVNSSLLRPYISQMRKEKSIMQLKDLDEKNMLHSVVNQENLICEIQSSDILNIKDSLPRYIFDYEAPIVKSSAAQMDNYNQRYVMDKSSKEATIAYEQGLFPLDNQSPQRRKLVPIKPKIENTSMPTKVANIGKSTLFKPGINGYVEDSRKSIGKINKNNFHTKDSEFISDSSATNAISSNSNTSEKDKSSTSVATNKSLVDKMQYLASDVIQEEQNIQLNTSDGVVLLRPTDLTKNTKLISSLPAEDLNEGCVLLTSQDWLNMTEAQNPIYYASDFHLAVPPLIKLSSAKSKHDEVHINKRYTKIKITQNKGEGTTFSRHKRPIIIKKVNLMKQHPMTTSSNSSLSTPSTIAAADKPLISPSKNTSLVRSTNLLSKSFITESIKADSNKGVSGLGPKPSITPGMTLSLDKTKVSSQNTPAPVISNILSPLNIVQRKNAPSVVPQEEQNNKCKESSEILALHHIEAKNLQCIPTETLNTKKGCKVSTGKSDIICSSMQEQILSLPLTHLASRKVPKALPGKRTINKTALNCQKESLKKNFNDSNFPVTNDDETNLKFYKMYKERAEQLKKKNDYLDITEYLKNLEETYLNSKTRKHKPNNEHVETSEFILPLISNVCTVADSEELKKNTKEVVAPQVPLINECIQDNPNKQEINNHFKTTTISKKEQLETPEGDNLDKTKEISRQMLSSQLHLLNSWKENYLKQLSDDHKYSKSIPLHKKTVLSNKDVGSKKMQSSASNMVLPVISSVFTVLEDSISELANTQNPVLSMALDNNDDANSFQLQFQTNKDLIQNKYGRSEKICLNKAVSVSRKALSISPNCNDTVTNNIAVTQITDPEMKGRLEYNSSDNSQLPCGGNKRSHNNKDSQYFKSENTQQKNVHTLPTGVQSNSYALDQIFFIDEKWPNDDDDDELNGSSALFKSNSFEEQKLALSESVVLRDILEQIKQESLENEQCNLFNSLDVEINEELGDENEWSEFPLIGASASESVEILPPKSKLKYESTYNVFQQWCQEKNFEEKTETVLLQYFSEKSHVLKSSTLWSQFSMLKATIAVNDNIDIGKFKRLTTLLKVNYKRYVATNARMATKSRIFTKEEVQSFLKDAPDEIYLMMKVVLIIGISGGCRRDELAQLTVDDIDDLGAALLIKIPDEKTNIQRTFTVIPEKENELNCLEIYRKYKSLRPQDLRLTTKRFFLTYKLGKCSKQVVGVNTFGKIPSRIAKFLQLPDPYSYNGHCFRRSSLSLNKSDKRF